MPPKGGNPALTDQQIMDIIAYLRTCTVPPHSGQLRGLFFTLAPLGR